MLTFSLWGDKCEHHWHNSCVTMSRWLQYTDNHHCVVVTVCPITVCCSLFFIWHRDIRARKMWVHDMILRETKRVPEWTQMKVLCRCFKFLFFLLLLMSWAPQNKLYPSWLCLGGGRNLKLCAHTTVTISGQSEQRFSVTWMNLFTCTASPFK